MAAMVASAIGIPAGPNNDTPGEASTLAAIDAMLDACWMPSCNSCWANCFFLSFSCSLSAFASSAANISRSFDLLARLLANPASWRSFSLSRSSSSSCWRSRMLSSSSSFLAIAASVLALVASNTASNTLPIPETIAFSVSSSISNAFCNFSESVRSDPCTSGLSDIFLTAACTLPTISTAARSVVASPLTATSSISSSPWFLTFSISLSVCFSMASNSAAFSLAKSTSLPAAFAFSSSARNASSMDAFATFASANILCSGSNVSSCTLSAASVIIFTCFSKASLTSLMRANLSFAAASAASRSACINPWIFRSSPNFTASLLAWANRADAFNAARFSFSCSVTRSPLPFNRRFSTKYNCCFSR